MGEGATLEAGGVGDRVLHTSVAMLYSNLVTRPTGQAVRFAIERQIQETPGPCVSILDFSQVGVIDFSCADEVIAKLLSKYKASSRPSEAYFVLQGVSEHHREPIETVLKQRNLLLVAVVSGRPTLWGPAPPRLRMAWDWLGQLGQGVSDEFASARGLSADTAASWLKRLVSSRVAVAEGRASFVSLPTVVDKESVYGRQAMEIDPCRKAAEEDAPYANGSERGDDAKRWRSPT